uniref:Tetratricopeptide repeat domain 23 n=1 Tax=Cyprinus carpio carpio TaxID=630221 RepID=A0A9J7ZZG0_CYPCA
MTTPAEKLSLCERRAHLMFYACSTLQYDPCMQELVRCLALNRLVYGNEHFAVAQAQSRLAKAYLQYKGKIKKRVSCLNCFLTIHQTLGSATLLLGKYHCLHKHLIKSYSYRSASLVFKSFIGTLHIFVCMRLLNTSIEVEKIIINQTFGRPEKALSQCERALELLQEGAHLSQICCVYRNMAAIEQAQGHLDRSLYLSLPLLQAHSIALSQSPGGLEGAQIAHSLALAYSSTSEPHHNNSAARFFAESINSYRSALVGVTLCFVFQRCAEIQRESLAYKKNTFGELSAEVAEALQLIGGVEMTQGQMRHAHSTLKKSLSNCSLHKKRSEQLFQLKSLRNLCPQSYASVLECSMNHISPQRGCFF